MEIQPDEIKETVKERYSELARQQQTISCCGSDEKQACCGPNALYSREQLTGIPDGIADSSLGCGDPTAIADLKPGEVVLDLGCGGGLDCFLAARRVGKKGRVIGLDMTPDMIHLATENARKMGATNVEFRLGEMEQMPVDNESVDAIISNCVINLSPDKDAVFREAFRVLKPGGRLAISDKALLAELPEVLQDNPDAWSCCIAGAINKDDYLAKIKAAGFTDLTAEEEKTPLFVELGCGCGEDDCAGSTAERLDLSETVINLRVRARKPG